MRGVLLLVILALAGCAAPAEKFAPSTTTPPSRTPSDATPTPPAAPSQPPETTPVSAPEAPSMPDAGAAPPPDASAPTPASPEAPSPTPTSPTPTSPAPASPAPSSPAPEPTAPSSEPATPTPPGAGIVRNVLFLNDTSIEVFPGSERRFCWRVEGEGSIPHMEVHTDSASRRSQTFDPTPPDAYHGPRYPVEGHADGTPIPIPGDFCARIPVPDAGHVYFTVHTLDREGSPGRVWGEGHWAVGTRGPTTITRVHLHALPQNAQTGDRIGVCWRIEGTGPSPPANATGILTDDASHGPDPGAYAGARYLNDKPGYSEDVTLPAGACTHIPLPDRLPPGTTLRLRAYAIAPNGTWILSEEGSLPVEGRTDVAQEIRIVSMKRAPIPGGQATACWRVEGNGVLQGTWLAWTTGGTESRTYADNETGPSPRFMPGTFCAGFPEATSADVRLVARVKDAAGELASEEVLVAGSGGV